MELEKYIRAMTPIIWNGYAGIEAALMERDTTQKDLKKRVNKLSNEGYHDEYQKIVDKFNVDAQAAVTNCRTAIQKQKDGFMKEVREYYAPDGSKIDLNDMNLIKAGFDMTADEFVDMIKKHKDNPVMLRIIEKYAVEKQMLDSIRAKSSVCAIALMRAKKAGKNEEKIIDTYIQLSTAGMAHPAENYTLFQSRLNDYEEDAILNLLKLRVWADNETQRRIDQIEAAQRQKRNDARKGKDWMH